MKLPPPPPPPPGFHEAMRRNEEERNKARAARIKEVERARRILRSLNPLHEQYAKLEAKIREMEKGI